MKKIISSFVCLFMAVSFVDAMDEPSAALSKALNTFNVNKSDKNKRAIESLLEAKVDVNGATQAGWTSLHDAAAYQLTEIAQLLIHHKANVNAADNSGATVLHVAVSSQNQKLAQNIPMISLLLNNKADINALCHAKWAPLDYACCCKDEEYREVKKLLIDRGACAYVSGRSVFF